MVGGVVVVPAQNARAFQSGVVEHGAQMARDELCLLARGHCHRWPSRLRVVGFVRHGEREQRQSALRIQSRKTGDIARIGGIHAAPQMAGDPRVAPFAEHAEIRFHPPWRAPRARHNVERMRLRGERTVVRGLDHGQHALHLGCEIEGVEIAVGESAHEAVRRAHMVAWADWLTEHRDAYAVARAEQIADASLFVCDAIVPQPARRLGDRCAEAVDGLAHASRVDAERGGAGV